MQKLKSTKLWVTLWAMFMVTYIIVTKQTDFTSIATLLSGAPMVYMGANVAQKKIFSDDEK